MFENPIKRFYGGGTIEGARKAGGLDEKQSKFPPLPEKIEKMLCSSQIKIIQGQYLFGELKEDYHEISLEAVDGTYLGKVHVLGSFNYLEHIIKERKAVPIKECLKGYPMRSVSISFIPLEEGRMHSLFGMAKEEKERLKWKKGIFMLCLFPL